MDVHVDGKQPRPFFIKSYIVCYLEEGDVWKLAEQLMQVMLSEVFTGPGVLNFPALLLTS